MKRLLLFVLVLLPFGSTLSAQEPVRVSIFKELFAGPENKNSFESWLSSMKRWRTDERKRIDYKDSYYNKPELAWSKTTFIYAQVMAHDRFIFDPVTQKYTVDRYLNDLKKRYGGLDAVLIWPTYPNIGIDNRNQFDLTEDMPGGLDGVRQMIKDFKKRGVRVFLPIMKWDYGTRDAGLTMATALVREAKILEVDGLNGDTMLGVTEDYKNASDSMDYPLAFQPEVYLDDLRMIKWNNMSWGYWWNDWTDPYYSFKPGVSVYKWLEPRHQVSVTNRWAVDKTNDLQFAFFNGAGYNAWENIWGIWNQVPDRYAEAIRRIATIYRQFPNAWSSKDWVPYFPTIQNGIFASKFPDDGLELYTIINRNNTERIGRQLTLPFKDGIKYYDVWNGKELEPEKEGEDIFLSFSIEGRGYGAVLAIKGPEVNSSFNHFIKEMNRLSEKNLSDFSDKWEPLLQEIVPIGKTKSYTQCPKGMIEIPATDRFAFESNGVMIEGNDLPRAVGVQHPWESHPSRSQKHVMAIPSFYIDQYPITNKEFKKFMEATHYQPADAHNFLKDWKNGTYPKGWANKPVTWVSIEDARAYAAWAGKRLPHEWEWQYAAQGTNGNLYPWGNVMDPTRMPAGDTSRNMREPTDVNKFPQGATSSQIMDMVGNIWQWTDEYTDDHTRFAILKGGSYFRPQTSYWYFPQAHELNKYGKYILMSPGLDRSGTVDFRCVADR